MKRDARIDNLRGVLIFLVVLGHLYDTVRFPTSVFQTAVIYSFHVPAFAFVSGVCFKYRGQDDRRALKNLLYPYVPEFKSRPNKPHPLFLGFIGAAFERSGKKEK